MNNQTNEEDLFTLFKNQLKETLSLKKSERPNLIERSLTLFQIIGPCAFYTANYYWNSYTGCIYLET